MNRFYRGIVLDDLDGTVEFEDTITGSPSLIIRFCPVNPNGILDLPVGSFVSGPAGTFINEGGTTWGHVSTTGGTGYATLAEVPFTFTNGTTVLKALAPGDVVSPCYVRIETPWNLPGASISIGTPSAPGALLAPGDVNLYRTSRYDAGLDFKATLAEDLQLIVSGPSTTGTGYVVFTTG